MNVFINSYYPIIQTQFGRKASINFNIHPLEDGSIRREPDLRHKYPGISGLCRPGSMKDIRLSTGDIMIYKTNGTHYLAAILVVFKLFQNHQEAADWLKDRKYEIPSNNILVDPLPLDRSHVLNYVSKVGRSKRVNDLIHLQWNRDYMKRGQSNRSSYFFLTKSIYNAVHKELKKRDFISIDQVLRKHYGQIPNTAWRPQSITKDCYIDILKLTKNSRWHKLCKFLKKLFSN